MTRDDLLRPVFLASARGRRAAERLSIPASVVIEGIVLGLNYGLLALGLVLVYRTSRILNFAQGQLGVVAAVLLVKLYYDFGINYWGALVVVLGWPPAPAPCPSWCCAGCSTGPGSW